MSREDTSTIGPATVGLGTGSTPLPSQESQVYHPSFSEVENQIQTRQMLNNLDQRVSILKSRLDLLDETVKAILEGEDVSDGELLKWFKGHRDSLQRDYNKITR